MPHEDNPSPKHLVVITGMSGAGKSTASKALEDAGFFSIENMPAVLIPALLQEAALKQHEKLSLVMDARDQDFLSLHQKIIKDLKGSQYSVTIIFIDAQDQVLLQRFSVVRRKHPFAGKSVKEDIFLERQKLAAIKSKADVLIDTSSMTPHALRSELLKKFNTQGKDLQISIISFGFKHGLPVEADIIFDVRFLPNPYFVEALKMRTGLEKDVSAYVIESEASQQFFDKLLPLLKFLIPQYRQEGKVLLTIAIGCTGGRHRSVAVTEKLRVLIHEFGEDVTACHRDLDI